MMIKAPKPKKKVHQFTVIYSNFWQSKLPETFLEALEVQDLLTTFLPSCVYYRDFEDCFALFSSILALLEKLFGNFGKIFYPSPSPSPVPVPASPLSSVHEYSQDDLLHCTLHCTVQCTVVSTCNEVYPAQCTVHSSVENCTKHRTVPL